jgi:hypothetical protein
MIDVFNETLHSWQNFYFMIGGASATLIGLMFVAVSLGIGLVTESTRESVALFVTPSVIYFVSVLLLASVMLVPAFSPPLLALILFVGSTIGLIRVVPFAKQLFKMAKKHQDFNLQEWLTQVIVPVVAYLLTLASAVFFASEQWSMAFASVCIGTMLVLICAIANTWSLIVWIVEQRTT